VKRAQAWARKPGPKFRLGFGSRLNEPHFLKKLNTGLKLALKFLTCLKIGLKGYFSKAFVIRAQLSKIELGSGLKKMGPSHLWLKNSFLPKQKPKMKLDQTEKDSRF